MARLRARVLTRAATTVALPQPIGAVACPALLAALLKHTLYMHLQLPCPYDEVLRSLNDSTSAERPRRPGGAKRKAATLVRAMELLLGSLAAAFEAALSAGGPAAPPPVAAVVLGRSAAAPKLVYLVRLGLNALEDAPPEPARVRDACRRMIRSICTRCAELAALDPGLCRTHVLFAAARHAQLPAGTFQPRPGFTLKLKRAHVACIDLRGGGDDAPAIATVDEALEWRSAPLDGLVVATPPPPRLPSTRVPPQSAPAAAAGAADADAGMRDALPEPLIWFKSTAKIKGWRAPQGTGGGV